MCQEGFGIEHIPELQHHESREEHRQFIASKHIVRMRGHIHHPQQQDGKTDADAQDVIPHGRGNDKVAGLAWRLVHHLLVGWEGSQGGCGKGIHNHVYPKHLGYRQRQLMPHDGAYQHNEQRGQVDGQLEQDKALDIVVKRASPHDSCRDAVERIV